MLKLFFWMGRMSSKFESHGCVNTKTGRRWPVWPESRKVGGGSGEPLKVFE